MYLYEVVSEVMFLNPCRLHLQLSSNILRAKETQLDLTCTYLINLHHSRNSPYWIKACHPNGVKIKKNCRDYLLKAFSESYAWLQDNRKHKVKGEDRDKSERKWMNLNFISLGTLIKTEHYNLYIGKWLQLNCDIRGLWL